MASSRYRSQFFQAFSRQTMRLGDRLAQTWRQTRLTAAWGAQILLYPIYALYQGTRLASRSIGQAVSRILPQLQSSPASDPANLPIDEQTDLGAPVDMPIVRSLLALAGLELALTPVLPAADGALATASATPIVIVDLPGAIAPATREIISDQADAIAPATVRVRGFASLVSDRRLVLTTIHNQLLDVLTAGQQIQLQQRIVWELASYQRLLRLRSSSRSLPLRTADSPHLLPPIRSFRRLMAWVQQSPIAIATNLFGEASQLAAAPIHPGLPPAPEPRSTSPSYVSGRSPWAWLGDLFRPAAARLSVPPRSAQSISTIDAPLIATTSPQKKAWWKRKRLAASSKMPQPSIAVLGRAAVPPQGFDRSLAATERSAATTANSSEAGDRLAQTAALTVEPQVTVPTAAPNWIETDARLVGYVKHPLEQLLEWLDAGMLWIETALSNVWRWLSGNSR